MFRRSLVVILCAATVVGLMAYWLNRPQESIAVTSTPFAAAEIRESAEERVPTVFFTDVTASAGIDFVHCNAAYGDKLLPDIMSGGVGFID